MLAEDAPRVILLGNPVGRGTKDGRALVELTHNIGATIGWQHGGMNVDCTMCRNGAEFRCDPIGKGEAGNQIRFERTNQGCGNRA